VELSWIEPEADAMHDAPVFYPVYVSSAPDGGFSIKATPSQTLVVRPLDSSTEFYIVGAVNGGGTSGEEPAP